MPPILTHGIRAGRNVIAATTDLDPLVESSRILDVRQTQFDFTSSGETVSYKLRGWKNPVTLGGAYYWASRMSLGNQPIDPTRNARLILPGWYTQTEAEGLNTNVSFSAPPDLIVLNPSDIIHGGMWATDREDFDEVTHDGNHKIYRSGHSLSPALPKQDNDRIIRDMDYAAHINIGHLIGTAEVEGRTYDVAMAPRDDRIFFVKLRSKEIEIDGETVTLGAGKYAAQILWRPSNWYGNVAFLPEQAMYHVLIGQLNDVGETRCDCIFLDAEMADDLLDPGEEDLDPLSPIGMGAIVGFQGETDRIPMIAGFSLMSTTCIPPEEEGSGE